MYQFHEDGDVPDSAFGAVWVFGSNLAGRHGKGSAKVAADHFGARRGVGIGPTGQAYAIPTKDGELRVLPLGQIGVAIAGFLQYAAARPDTQFWVTRIGCGLAGYRDEQIAPLFHGAPANCHFAQEWQRFLEAPDRHQPRP